MSTRTISRGVIGLAATVLGAHSANAQQPQTNVPGALEEVLVTAEKRTQNLQEVPIAITAFSADFIEQSRIENFSDVSLRVPSLTFSTFTKTRTLPALRGAASTIDAPGGDQSVAIFIDEVYQGAVGDFDPELFDLERVEVLRGPQGTLFGRNVVGGAISLVTRKPDASPYAKAEIGLGNHNAVTARGAFSTALTDSLFGQLSFSSRNRDGTSYNRTTGRDVDSDEKNTVRARLRYVPSDAVEVIFGGDYLRDTSSGSARDFLGPPPSIPEFAGFVPDLDRRTVHQYKDAQLDRETMGLSATVNVDTGLGRFTSISAWRANDTVLDDEDAIGAPLPTLTGGYDNKLDQYSQELRLVSTDDGPFEWVAGLYYLRIENSQIEDLNATFYADTIFGDIQQGIFGTLGLHRNRFFQDVTTDSYAVYAQGTYSITEALKLTLGGRYTQDDKSGNGATQVFEPNFFFGADSFSTDFSESWDSFTPRVSLDYRITDDILAYATYSEGFKSGGFVVQGDAATTATPYGPETAINHEIGLKTRFFDDRLQLNLTAFHVDYEDLQVDITLPSGVTIVANAGEAKVDGVEVELQVAPVDGLLLWGNYSYLDSEYEDFGPFTGIEMALTPPNAFSVGASYTANVSSRARVTLQADYQYKDTFLLEPRIAAEQGPFRSGFDEMINASLTFGLDGSSWEVVLWGKNLADETYVVYGQDLWPIIYSEADIVNTGGAAAAANFPRYNQPRTYGLSVRWQL